MKLKYRCLVLDHDDTAVKSTPEIHYPQWCETLEALRPGTKMSLYEFMQYNFDIGFFEMSRSVMGFTKEETDIEHKMWKEYMKTHTADFYEGIAEIIADFKALGGILCVSSHSNTKNILADFNAAGISPPDRIYDCDMGEDKIKPNPFALFDIMERYSLRSGDILMVDDMKPGLEMARNANVAFACAGWSHIVPEIREYMKTHCETYLENTAQLRNLLFDE